MSIDQQVFKLVMAYLNRNNASDLNFDTRERPQIKQVVILLQIKIPFSYENLIPSSFFWVNISGLFPFFSETKRQFEY